MKQTEHIILKYTACPSCNAISCTHFIDVILETCKCDKCGKTTNLYAFMEHFFKLNNKMADSNKT